MRSLLTHLILCIVAVGPLFPAQVDAAEEQKWNSIMKPVKKFVLPIEFRGVSGNGGLAYKNDTSMYFRSWYYCYIPPTQTFWQISKSELLKFSYASEKMSRYPLDFDMFDKRAYVYQRYLTPEIRSKTHHYRDDYLIVSPGEKLAIFRYPYWKSELYDIKTQKKISEGIDDEVILGFDQNDNIWCGRQSCENILVLRDPRDMSAIKRFTLLSDNQSDKISFDKVNQYNTCIAPFETPDGRFLVHVFTIPELENKKNNVAIWDVKTEKLIHHSSIDICYSPNFLPAIQADGKAIAMASGQKSVWVYDFKRQQAMEFHLTRPENPDNNQWMQGFCFAPNDNLVLWSTHPADTRTGGSGSFACRFDLENVGGYEYTSFSIEGRYTRSYFFSPDEKTAITFETIPGRYQDWEHLGRYVVWDTATGKRLCETQEIYQPNIIIAPDWKTCYLTKASMESVQESDELKFIAPVVEVYDITTIINRK